MNLIRSRRCLAGVLAVAASWSAALAQTAPPPAAPVRPDSVAAKPAPPPSPVVSMRGKISAGDLFSAESLLEVYRAKYGQDGSYLIGSSWLARGAFLLGDTARARTYAADVRSQCADRIQSGASLATDHDLEYALGSAIEVHAQLLERSRGARHAVSYLQSELGHSDWPVALRSRLTKRINMIALTGSPAPEIKVEDFIGEAPASLASLKGKPVLIFIWAEGCGDSKAQAAALAQARKHLAAPDLQLVALTRYFEEGPDHAKEKARADSVWKAAYADVGPASVVLSTASMERYGGSSTPTFVFVDRAGIVRRYTPTRLTQAEIERTLAPLVR